MSPAIIILGIFGAAVIATAAYAGLRAAPWVPTWDTDVRRFLKLARITPGQRFVDLGCGDGRLVFAAARAGAIATGYEISLLPYTIALIRRAFLPRAVRARAHIRYRDFWSADLRDADLVYTFLMPERRERLMRKCKQEMQPGARIVTYVWPFEGWAPVATDTEPGRLKLFLYKL